MSASMVNLLTYLFGYQTDVAWYQTMVWCHNTKVNVKKLISL